MRRTFHKLPRLARFGALLVLSLSTLSGCGDQDRRGGAAGDTAARSIPASSEAERTPVTVERVREAPQRFYGERVQVSGEVDEMFGERAFELEGTGWAFGDNITVLARTPVSFGPDALLLADQLVVTGTVRRFVTAEVERDLGWDLAPELEARLKERPVLIADSIFRTTETGRWSADGIAELAPLTSVLAVVSRSDQKAMAGRPVEFRSETVRAVMGEGLWVGPSHMSQLFVLPTRIPAGVQAGDLVQVSGTLQKTPVNALKVWRLPATMAGAVRDEGIFVDAATVQEFPARERGSGT